jgi:hypothetical protein
MFLSSFTSSNEANFPQKFYLILNRTCLYLFYCGICLLMEQCFIKAQVSYKGLIDNLKGFDIPENTVEFVH